MPEFVIEAIVEIQKTFVQGHYDIAHERCRAPLGPRSKIVS